VKDEAFLPVEFANIVILTKSDSAFVAGCVTDNAGGFSITNIKEGSYILKTSFITFQDVYKEVSVMNNNFDIGTIYLKAQDRELKEIVVTSRQPPFKTKQGALIANVSNTQLSTLGTATDVIQRIPGIIANDESISVFGKGTPVVYIDNRIVNDFSELEILQSSDIATVELITNSGAKYSASARSIIRIKTKRKQAGFSAYASKRFILGKHFGGDENINLTFTKNNLNLFASYNHLYQKRDVKEQDHFIARFDTIWHHNITTPHTTSVERNQVVTGFEWNKNDKHIVGAQYQTFFTKGKTNINALGTTSANDALYDNIRTVSQVKDRPNRHLVNAFYKGEITQNTSIQFIFDYLKNYMKSDQFTKESSTLDSNRDVDVLSQSNFHLYASKMELTHKTHIGTFDIGGEYNKITGDGFLINSKGYIRNNIYDNEEQKIAGFINYSYSKDGFGINTGIRYEYVTEKVIEDSIATLKVDRKYSSVYPNISISKKFENVQFDLSFSKKVQRPSFTQLNGNVTYTNKFIMQQGDPYLQKTDIYDINLVASYKKMYFNLGYIYQKDPIAFFGVLGLTY
jgi:UDP-3-O-acyl-N-acetylglucosamine deacetylase